jgi:hypothetical protein
MKLEEGEKVLLWDISGTFLTAPQVVTVRYVQDGRLHFTFKDGNTMHGSLRRFRKLTKLEKALK